MESRSITIASAPLDHEVRVPGSKSLASRALLAAALARGCAVLDNVPLADDIRFLIAGLRQMGVEIRPGPQDRRFEVVGSAGRLPATSAEIDCGESGTMLRLLAGACAASRGTFRLFGRGRLHERPMQPLVEALHTLGARVECTGRPGCAPLTIRAGGLRGGAVAVDGSLSSQFASAILLSAPCASAAVGLELRGAQVSRPYLTLTIEVMRRFGVRVERGAPGRLVVPAPQPYRATAMVIESDASSAVYFLAAGVICGGRVRVPGVGRGSRQGDLQMMRLLERMGAALSVDHAAVEVRSSRDSGPLRSFDVDFADMPDAVPTAAVLALFANGISRLRGVSHLRHKESDRLAGLAAELQRLGATVVIAPDSLSVQPPVRIQPAILRTYGDHRLAMALSLVGLAVPGVAVENPACVSKSFPDYFEQLELLARPQMRTEGLRTEGLRTED